MMKWFKIHLEGDKYLCASVGPVFSWFEILWVLQVI